MIFRSFFDILQMSLEKGGMMKLVLPEKKYWSQVQKAVTSLLENRGEYDPVVACQLIEAVSFESYDKQCADAREGKGLKAGYVPHTILWLIDDAEEFAGIFDVRHYLTEDLLKIGGHIAYYVVPSKRRKGYASQGLDLCLGYAFETLKLDKVLIHCSEKNEASWRTMCGAVRRFGGFSVPSFEYEGKIKKGVWVNTSQRGSGTIRVIVVGVARKGEKILLMPGYDHEKKETFFRFIGGGVEFGETGDAALRREFREEFGLNVHDTSFLGTVENIFCYNGKPGHEIVLVYEVVLSPENLKQDSFSALEAEQRGLEARWIEWDEKMIVYPQKVMDFIR